MGICLLSAPVGMGQGSDAPSSQITPSFLPVVIQSHRDGLLLGAELRLGIGAQENNIRQFTLGVGGAYGFGSRAARFRTQLNFRNLIELSYGDWPESPIFGRVGEQGIRFSNDLIALYRLVDQRDGGFISQMIQGSRLRGTVFEGSLWNVESEEANPEVQYAYLDALVHWPFFTGFTVDTIGELLIGRKIEAPERIFSAFTSTTRFILGNLAIGIELGEIENGANLADFAVDLGMKSYPNEFSGERFFVGTLEKTFALFSDQVYQLDLRGLLGTQVGWLPIYMNVETSVYFEGGVTLDRENVIEEILFGWGASLRFPDLQMRVDLAINREGQPRLILETGILP